MKVNTFVPKVLPHFAFVAQKILTPADEGVFVSQKIFTLADKGVKIRDFLGPSGVRLVKG